jgi:hypothetical protein
VNNVKVPKWVEESAIKSARHREIADKENEKIREWLDKNNLTEGLGIIDALIDSIELTNNPNGFINHLKEYEIQDET